MGRYMHVIITRVLDIRNYCILICLFCALLCSCNTAEFHHPQIDVHGMVYDYENRPVAGYNLAFGGYKTRTDVSGRFSIPSMPLGSYNVIGKMEGYESYLAVITIGSKTDIVYIRIASFSDVINMTENALSANDNCSAEKYASRALCIDSDNNLGLFYLAVIKFRLQCFTESKTILEGIEKKGFGDIYTRKMLDFINSQGKKSNEE